MVYKMRFCAMPRSILFACVLAAFFASGAVARFLVDDTTELPQDTQDQKKEDTKKPSASDTSGMTPDYPRGIAATIVQGEKNSIQITWDMVAEGRDSFLVLRSNLLQNTSDTVLGSIPLKVVPPDKLKVVIDRNLPPGKYFYAVVPKAKFDDRSVRMFPGENYITNPVIIQGDTELGDSRTVNAIKAVTIDDRSVLLTWEPVANFTGEYVIFRGKAPIDTPDKLNAADPIARISSVKSRYLDNDITPGRHFYAVACKTVDGILFSDLKKGINYTDDAVFVGGTIGIRGIRARIEGANVTLTWKMAADSFTKNFYLLRSEARPVARESLAGSYIVDTVKSSDEKYTDRNVPVGKYYYILAPVNYREEDSFILIPGVNVVDPPVIIAGETKQDDTGTVVQTKPDAVKKSAAPSLPKTDFSSTDFDITSYLDELKALSSETKKSPVAEKPTAPRQSNAVPVFPWENDDGSESATAQQPSEKIAPPAQNEKKAVTTPKDETPNPPATKKSEPVNPDSKKTTSAQPSDRKTVVSRKLIDAIIAGPFSRGEYTDSIKAFKQALESSTTGDAAKARLYIARAYIELGKYRDAITYLNNDDVNRYFPKETVFWKDYSISRLK